MAVRIGDKLKQLNDNKFFLMDAIDVEMSNGQDLESYLSTLKTTEITVTQIDINDENKIVLSLSNGTQLTSSSPIPLDKNKIEAIKVNGSILSIDNNKTVDIVIPTKSSDLINDSEFQTKLQVDNAIMNAQLSNGDVDLSGYATIEYMNTQLDSKSNTDHSHSYNDLLDKPILLNGKDGKDGVSPSVTSTKTGKVTTVKIQDSTHIETITILDGQDGDVTNLHNHDNKDVLDSITSDSVNAWENKADISDIPVKLSELQNDSEFQTKSQIDEKLSSKANTAHSHSCNDIIDFPTLSNGEDGFSPIVTTEKIGTTTTVKIQDATHTETIIIKDGENGRDANSHEHENKEILDSITSSIVDNWNNKAEHSDIPSKISELQNDSKLLSYSEVDNAEIGNITGNGNSNVFYESQNYTLLSKETLSEDLVLWTVPLNDYIADGYTDFIFDIYIKASSNVSKGGYVRLKFTGYSRDSELGYRYEGYPVNDHGNAAPSFEIINANNSLGTSTSFLKTTSQMKILDVENEIIEFNASGFSGSWQVSSLATGNTRIMKAPLNNQSVSILTDSSNPCGVGSVIDIYGKKESSKSLEELFQAYVDQKILGGEF